MGQGLDINGNPPSEIRTVAIVRDKDGNPRFDDPDNVPEIVLAALSEQDLEYLHKLRNQ